MVHAKATMVFLNALCPAQITFLVVLVLQYILYEVLR